MNKHIWFIGVNRTNVPFYTSDNPVVKFAHKKESFKSNAGIGSPGVEIAFPISKELIILIREKEFFEEYEKCENTFVLMNEENVKFYNWLQATESYKQIYSVCKDFDLVKEIKKTEPASLERRMRIEIIAGGKKI